MRSVSTLGRAASSALGTCSRRATTQPWERNLPGGASMVHGIRLGAAVLFWSCTKKRFPTPAQSAILAQFCCYVQQTHIPLSFNIRIKSLTEWEQLGVPAIGEMLTPLWCQRYGTNPTIMIMLQKTSKLWTDHLIKI